MNEENPILIAFQMIIGIIGVIVMPVVMLAIALVPLILWFVMMSGILFIGLKFVHLFT